MSDRAGGWDAANPFAFRTTHFMLRAVGYPIEYLAIKLKSRQMKVEQKSYRAFRIVIIEAANS